MGDGRVWPLADYIPAFAACWDRLHDSNFLRGQYELEDVHLAAARLLLANFDLAPEAVATLVAGADPDGLVGAVEDAMFGPERSHVTWSDWALGSLFASGIDPASVPPERLRSVLETLVATGRAVPPGKCISAAAAGVRLAAIRARAGPADEAQATPAGQPEDAP
jgi:hypothetical protein